MQLATLNLQVSDPEASCRFYRDVLGMDVDGRRTRLPGFAYLRSANGCAVTLAQSPYAPAPTPGVELGFEAADLAGIAERLRRLGVALHEQSMDWGASLELRDPDGYPIVIYQLRE